MLFRKNPEDLGIDSDGMTGRHGNPQRSEFKYERDKKEQLSLFAGRCANRDLSKPYLDHRYCVEFNVRLPLVGLYSQMRRALSRVQKISKSAS